MTAAESLLSESMESSLLVVVVVRRRMSCMEKEAQFT